MVKNIRAPLQVSLIKGEYLKASIVEKTNSRLFSASDNPTTLQKNWNLQTFCLWDNSEPTIFLKWFQNFLNYSVFFWCLNRQVLTSVVKTAFQVSRGIRSVPLLQLCQLKHLLEAIHRRKNLHIQLMIQLREKITAGNTTSCNITSIGFHFSFFNL